MEAITKERFLARLYEMRSKQANNSRAITQGDYDNIIKKLKLLDKKVKGKSIPGFTSNDYNLANTHVYIYIFIFKRDKTFLNFSFQRSSHLLPYNQCSC